MKKIIQSGRRMNKEWIYIGSGWVRDITIAEILQCEKVYSKQAKKNRTTYLQAVNPQNKRLKTQK